MDCKGVLITSVPFLLLISLSYCSIPSYIKLCREKDPEIEKCINDSISFLRPKLKEGIPELDIPAIEPLPLDEVQLRTGPTSAKIDANLTNLKVWGAGDFTITDLKVDLPKKRFIYRVTVPHLYFTGNYDVDMQVLLLSLHGKGAMHGNITNYQGDCLMKGKKITQDGKTYLKITSIRLMVYLGKSSIFLENLFSDNAVIGKAANEVIADNADLFMNEIKPNLEAALSDKFTEIANKITLKFTYDELFLQD